VCTDLVLKPAAELEAQRVRNPTGVVNAGARTVTL
jgi:hypothetical protein